MSNKLVSIIVPAYNVEHTIDETINSLLNQSYKNIELIIVNDGSTDNTLTKIESWKRKYENIKYLNQPNLGAASARNKGLEVSNGDFIQFMDADDIISNDKIENQLKLLNKFNAKICLCRSFSFNYLDDINNNRINKINDFIPTKEYFDAQYLFKSMYEGDNVYMIQPNSVLFHKSLISLAGKWNEKLNLDDDGEFFTRLFLVSDIITFDFISKNYYRKSNLLSLSNQNSERSFISAHQSLLLKIVNIHSSLNKSSTFKIERNLLSAFYYKYYIEFNERKEMKNIYYRLQHLGDFNVNFWPSFASRFLASILGSKFVFKIKKLLWTYIKK
jgi:glycosyltransferase involved in cell wall biosynthesis